MPDKLDPEFCRQIEQYHADLDRFVRLRRELSASDITPDELIRRFNQSNYHALYNSLRNKSNILRISIKWRAQYRLVRQLYDTLDPQKQPNAGNPISLRAAGQEWSLRKELHSR